ncbi:hypothetical protein FHW58_003681 [Duganella sp. 1224]|uniref:hypothetical protein n=1 Tax=Duganella sp. 1224 TaxID=2587052 RepID=UPI0015CC7EE9|nr:hypothetical protein [Duganella sp. 1224]NYE62466.1 hypothetical protein [Duganella sp. 1224]
MNTFELDTNGLSTGALSVLRAAIKHARSSASAGPHVVAVSNFYALANLPRDMPLPQFQELIKEVKHTALFSHDFSAGDLGASLVFESIVATSRHVEYVLSPHAEGASEPSEVANDHHMAQLNEALKTAVENADGNAEVFALYLGASIAGFMTQKMLNEDIAMQAVKFLHELHPSISI